MLKKIRVALAALFFLGITALLLDFTGTLHAWLGWMTRIQLLPAAMALNVGVLVGLAVLTLLFGRVYCSVICPLGVMQDIFSRFHRRRKARFRFSYTPAHNWWRYTIFGLFVVAIICGIGSFVALLAPYSSYGRIVNNLFEPLYRLGNNLLAYFAERADSYAFYHVDVWVKSLPVFIVAAVTFVALFFVAWRHGRLYCNTICPVGTLLGFLSRFSIFGIKINTDKCVNCGLCSRGCKAECIDGKNHRVDASRCVACMNCINICNEGAISFGLRGKGLRIKGMAPEASSNGPSDPGRRTLITTGILMGATAAVTAQTKKVDGGLAILTDKKVPRRQTRIVPPGAISSDHLADHCTGCQLCVNACPNDVLRPSGNILTFMQPQSSYERGYCRPECTACSDVCPAGAILPVTREQKTAIQIGHAVWIKNNCLAVTDGVACGNCERHCPSGAIQMVPLDENDFSSPMVPAVNEARCIGCGACENLCPARPFSAIYVEGHERHSKI